MGMVMQAFLFAQSGSSLSRRTNRKADTSAETVNQNSDIYQWKRNDE